MKKILFIGIYCLLLCGCEAKLDDRVQISELNYEGKYITGTMKNTTDKNYKLTINFETKDGKSKKESICYKNIKSNETKKFQCLDTEINEIHNIKVKDLKLEEFETPKLTKGIIDEKTLEYYYEEIYNRHYETMIHLDSKGNFPRFDKIEYSEDTIRLSNTLLYEDNLIFVGASYSTSDNEMNTLFVMLQSEDAEKEKNIIKMITLIPNESSYTFEIEKAFEEEFTSLDCNNVGELCYGKFRDNEKITYVVARNI